MTLNVKGIRFYVLIIGLRFELETSSLIVTQRMRFYVLNIGLRFEQLIGLKAVYA